VIRRRSRQGERRIDFILSCRRFFAQTILPLIEGSYIGKGRPPATIDVFQAQDAADQARIRYATALVRYNESPLGDGLALVELCAQGTRCQQLPGTLQTKFIKSPNELPGPKCPGAPKIEPNYCV